MNLSSSSIALVFAAILSGHAIASDARAADEAERTVFWPADFHPAVGPAAPTTSPLDRFEFRGVLTVDGATFITLVDTATQRSLIAAVGETVNGVTVSRFQSDTGSVVLIAGEQSKRLALPEAKIVAAAPPPVVPVRVHTRFPRPASVVPDGEDRSLAIAREIKRRQDMRRLMLEAQRPSVAPSPIP